MTKRLSILFTVVLLFQTFASSLFIPQQAFAEGNTSNDNGNSIVQEVEILDMDGNEVTEETDNNTPVKVNLKWSIKELDIESEDTYNIELPDSIQIETQQDGKLLDGEVELGTYHVGQEELVFETNEAIIDSPDAEGEIAFEAIYVNEEEDAAKLAEEDDEKNDESAKSKDEKLEDESDEVSDRVTDEEEPKEVEATEEDESNKEDKVTESTEKTKKEKNESNSSENNLLAEEHTDLGNIFIFESLMKNEEEIADGAVIDVGDGDSIELKFSWHTEGMDVKAGDFAETDIPDAFEFTKDMDGDIILDSGDKVGTFTIIDNKLRFEFDEGKETHGQVSNGTFTFKAKFNLEKFKKDVVEEIKFNGKEDKTLTIIGKPSQEIKSINKKGVPGSDQDASEITWTVDITNPSEEAVTGASLTDVIPEGLEIDASSIKVTHLAVGIDGELTEGDSFTANPDVNGQNLEIPLDNIDPYKGYRIEYTTKITDNSIPQFTNNANLVDGDKELPAKATVDITRSDLIEKYGHEKDNGNIEWNIDVNKAGGSIDEAIIEDTLPEGLVLESIEILKLTKSGDNWTEAESDKTATEFPVNLGELRSEDTYRIKVETSVDYSEVNDGNYEQATEFTNEATLKDGDKELDKDNDKVNIVRAAILSKKGSDVVIDHEEGKKLKWEVTVNKANHKIDNAVVTDTLPAGLTIDKADIVVENSNGEDVTNDVAITVPDNDGSASTTVTIDLGDITEKYTITYFTKVTDFSKNDFTNDASLDGTGVGPEDVTDTETTKPKGNYYGKRNTGRDIDKQIISWESSVVPHREAISELVITDTFSKKGLFLLEDTVKVTIDSKKLTKGTDYTLSPHANYKEGFKIEFDESVFPIREKVTVTYDTSYNLKDVEPNTGDKDKRYNDVNFNGETVNDNEIDVNKDANVKVGKTTVNSGKKEGKLVSIDEDGNQVNGWHSGNERKLEWEVYTNYLEQDLGTDVVVEDVLGYNAKVDIDNLIVKGYTVDKGNGNTTLGEAIDSSSYDVVATDDGFKLSFNEAVSERYAIVFTTSVPEISEGVYENTAKTIVGDKEYPYTGSISFDKADNHLSKKAIGIEGNEVFTDDEINWEIKINESLSIRENAKIVDTISQGMEYKNDSLEIFKLEGTNEVAVDSSAYDLDVRNKDDGKTELRIDFKDTISSTYVMKYTTIVTETDGEVNNTVDYSGSNFETTSVESEKLNAEQFSSTSGDKTRGKIQVVKVDANDENVKLEGAGFRLHYLFNDEKRYIETTDGEEIHKTNENGVIEFLGLQVNRTYFLEEVSPPEGYEILDGEVIEIDDLKSLNIEPKGYVETVENSKLIEVSGVKTWLDEDSESRPETITVELLGDKEFIKDQEVSADEDGDWTYTFAGLPKYAENGEEIDYTIEELEVEGYEATVTGTNIENVRTAKTSIEGEKIWKDENPIDRPDEIKVDLTRKVNGEVDENFTDSKTVKPDAKGNWVYEFTDLDEFNENGVSYTYIVKENSVPEGYVSSEENYDITNTRIEETEVSGTKRWKDDKIDDRPDSITVNLLRNNVPIESKNVSATDNWKYSFTGLDKYDEGGKYYEYKISEEQVPGYAPKVTGDNITNTRSEKTSFEITKGWLDGNSEERPDSIIAYLYQNDEKVNTVEIKAEDNWVYEVTDLEAYDQDGEPYTYTIKEKALEGYDSKVNGFNITNLRVGETEVSGEKTWKDNDDATGGRPESITVNLSQNGEEIDSIDVTAEDNWKYSFEELNKYDDQGVAYNYTIDEENVDGYKKAIDGNDLTNTRSAKTEFTGEKIWQDNNDATRNRPDEITVHLLQNGTIHATTTAKAEDDWKYSFEDIEEFNEEGIAYGYTIDEEDVDGYKKSTEGNNLINTRTGTTEISGEKTWLDNDDATGDRPDEITVILLQNGTEFARTEATAENDWTYNFEELPRFNDQGVEWGYTIDEEVVDGYKKSGDGTDLTNTRTGTTIVAGEKMWLDNDDATGDRPEEITVKLLQNGIEFARTEATAENDWQYSFEELPRFNDQGVAYGYTIDEVDVDGYKKSGDGTNLTNTRTGITKVAGKKTWQDNNAKKDRPEDITVILLQNGEEFARTDTTAKDNWEYSFKYLPEFNEKGVAYSYTVDEVDVDGYKKSSDGTNLTNTRTGTTEVTVGKTWKDEGKLDRPDSITVNLLQNGTVFTSKEIKSDEDGNWAHTFDNLPKFDGKGKVYEYTVSEHDVPGYVSNVDGFEIMNTRADEKSIVITKVWLDDNSENRPDKIEVELFRSIAKGEKESVGTYEVTAEENWVFKVTELPAFDPSGKAYTYELDEKEVKGYDTTINGFDITNVRVGETDISGTKIWKDDNSSDRPDTITVNLLQNGKKVDSKEVTAKDNWKYNFAGLDKYDEKGVAYDYSIEEVEVDGYKSVVDNFDIINIRTDKMDLDIVKIWKDDKASNRPDSITIDLLLNGEIIKTVKLNEQGDWKHTFSELDMYDGEGVAYNYSVQEKEVKGYQSDVQETDSGFEVTNTLESEEPGDPDKPDPEEPETPDKPDPEDPSDPGKPSDPGTPSDSGKPGSPGSPQGPDYSYKPGGSSQPGGTGGAIPKTATNNFDFIAIGVLMALVGAGLLVFRRRKES